MTVIIISWLIAFFFIIAEIYSYIFAKEKLSVRLSTTFVKILVLSLAVVVMISQRKVYEDCNFALEANDFKYECLVHLDTLTTLQQTMIDNLANHLWNEHDCDIPMFDSSLNDNIKKQQNIIDSLYNSQL